MNNSRISPNFSDTDNLTNNLYLFFGINIYLFVIEQYNEEDLIKIKLKSQGRYDDYFTY